MDTQLEKYIKIYKMLDTKFCKHLCQQLNENQFKRHSFRTYSNKIEYSEIDPKFSSADNHIDEKTYGIIMDQYYKVLERYVDELKFPWFSAWNGYSPPKFNLYEEGTAMKNHCDHIHSLFEGNPRGIPTLSMIATIYNDCEGGEFAMFDSDKTYNIDIGEVIIFPSIFLFPHEVKTVKKGKRITMVSWVY